MSCDYCTDPDGEPCFPVYGVGPHRHVGDNLMGSTVMLPREKWPSNFQEDPECPGLGVWWCPKCGDGAPDEAGAAPAHPGEGEKERK